MQFVSLTQMAASAVYDQHKQQQNATKLWLSATERPSGWLIWMTCLYKMHRPDASAPVAAQCSGG